MRTLLHKAAVGLMLVLCWYSTAWAQEPRLANGMLLAGTFLVKPEGIEVQTPAGPRLYTWEMLSFGTRFRHQPAFRAGFAAVLNGEPLPAYTPPPEPAPETPAPEAKPKRASRRKKAAE